MYMYSLFLHLHLFLLYKHWTKQMYSCYIEEKREKTRCVAILVERSKTLDFIKTKRCTFHLVICTMCSGLKKKTVWPKSIILDSLTVNIFTFFLHVSVVYFSRSIALQIQLFYFCSIRKHSTWDMCIWIVNGMMWMWMKMNEPHWPQAPLRKVHSINSK